MPLATARVMRCYCYDGAPGVVHIRYVMSTAHSALKAQTVLGPGTLLDSHINLYTVFSMQSLLASLLHFGVKF